MSSQEANGEASRLIAAAHDAARHAHAPYSRFAVGAAGESVDGTTGDTGPRRPTWRTARGIFTFFKTQR